GTRSGDVDPAVIEYLMEKEGFTIAQMDTLLNKQSGLLGISGLTNDMRDLLAEEQENNDRRAHLAVQIFVHRIRKYIGAYLAEMNGADAIVFTGGIGENSATIRQRVCQQMEWFGLHLDQERNNSLGSGTEARISAANSRIHAYVIPTDEELLIARDTVRLVRGIEVPSW
ncbi:MAG: acetate kinase, partial [Chlorobi bacterium CHB2]|nr:acetate kinase [Chlorobi bacterium CHB2]